MIPLSFKSVVARLNISKDKGLVLTPVEFIIISIVEQKGFQTTFDLLGIPFYTGLGILLRYLLYFFKLMIPLSFKSVVARLNISKDKGLVLTPVEFIIISIVEQKGFQTTFDLLGIPFYTGLGILLRYLLYFFKLMIPLSFKSVVA